MAQKMATANGFLRLRKSKREDWNDFGTTKSLSVGMIDNESIVSF